MNPDNRRTLFAVAAIVLGLLACGQAAAQITATPISVGFSFENLALRNPATEEQLRVFVADTLQQHFGIWSFQTAQSSAAGAEMHFTVVQIGENWCLKVTLARPGGGPDVPTWLVTLFQPDDLIRTGPLPSTVAAWKKQLAPKLDSFYTTHGEDVFAKLCARVPVGNRVMLPPPKPPDNTVIARLLVPDNRFQAYDCASFLITARAPLGSQTEGMRLVAQGLEDFSPSPPAIPVFVQYWISPSSNNQKISIQQRLNVLRELTLSHFYLEAGPPCDVFIAP